MLWGKWFWWFCEMSVELSWTTFPRIPLSLCFWLWWTTRKILSQKWSHSHSVFYSQKFRQTLLHLTNIIAHGSPDCCGSTAWPASTFPSPVFIVSFPISCTSFWEEGNQFFLQDIHSLKDRKTEIIQVPEHLRGFQSAIDLTHSISILPSWIPVP